MWIRCLIVGCVVLLLAAAGLHAATSEVADAAMKRDKQAVRALLQKKADVNTKQVDGTTALHWAVRFDDVEMAELLIRAGANVTAATRAGATPMQLAAINGNAAKAARITCVNQYSTIMRLRELVRRAAFAMA